MTSDDFHYSMEHLRGVCDTAENLKPGNVVELNWHHTIRIENRNTREDGVIEFVGELQRNNEWRVLAVETSRITPPLLTTPEKTHTIAVVDIQPVGGTVVSSKTAASVLSTDVAIDHAYSSRRVEVSEKHGQKVGECPVCGSWMWHDDSVVGCRDCGVWETLDVWLYWSERSDQVEYEPEKYEDDEDSVGLEYWIHDFD